MKNKKMRVLKISLQVILAIILAVIILIFVDKKFLLRGLNLTYQNNFIKQDKEISPLGPDNRVSKVEKENGVSFQRITGDLVYFDVKVPQRMKKVKAFLKFQTSDAQLFLGAKTGEPWKYQNILIYDRFLDSITWDKLEENGQILFQRKPNYKSISDFLTNPPLNQKIVVSEENKEGKINLKPVTVANYSDGQVKIEATLRGSQNMFTYIKNGEFNLSLKKEDLNWDVGPDEVKVEVYRDKELIKADIITDDGYMDDSKKTKTPQDYQLSLKNLGEGVYNIKIISNGDNLISGLSINQPYLVFKDQVYLADNPIYGKGIKLNSVFTGDPQIKAEIFHDQAKQEVKIIGQDDVEFEKGGDFKSISLEANLSQINVLQNDISLYGTYFSFSKDSFFVPFSPELVVLPPNYDYEGIDYILVNYKLTTKDNGWLWTESQYDLDQLFIKDGSINFMITDVHPSKEAPNTKIAEIKINYWAEGLLKFLDHKKR